jgi:TPR repeat protein
MKEGCESGLAFNCSMLAMAFETGAFDGYAEDEALAAAFYEQACFQKHAASCTSLGSMYESGRGVTKDEHLAVALYKQACDGGDKAGCDALQKLRQH